MWQGTPAHQQSRNAFSLSLPDPGDGAPLCTSVAGTRPVPLPPAQRGGLRLPFPCGGGGELPIPTSYMKREVPLQDAAAEGQRPRGSWPVKESSGGGERSRPSLPPLSKLPPSPLPSGKGGPSAGGPIPCHPPRGPVLRPFLGPPPAIVWPGWAAVRPFSFAPPARSPFAPTWAPLGEKKRAPAPTEGARSSFETARSAF